MSAPLRIASFILANMEPILLGWEDFARSLGAVTSSMDAAGLRDHAELILRAVAADLETEQTAAQQEAKSRGHAMPRPGRLPVMSANAHGAARAEEGFSLEQMVSEYRALRATVLRLWAFGGVGLASIDSYEQQIRFSEAIDEALADSVQTYAFAVDQRLLTKAQRRTEALGILAAGLGHDMRNVLLPMRSCLETLADEDTPKTAPVVRALQRAVEHLDGLSKGLRTLAMEPEQSEGASPATLLREWWASAISPFTWTLPKGVRLHVRGLGNPDPDLPPVRVPAHVLMQAVFNLVQNASQALDERGAANHGAQPAGNIWVSAGLDAPKNARGHTGARPTVYLTVRDDGPGMDEHTVARCTEVFFTTKAKDYGAGLGLYLVRSIVERHGGALFIESKVGEGSSFTLALPAAHVHEAPAPSL